MISRAHTSTQQGFFATSATRIGGLVCGLSCAVLLSLPAGDACAETSTAAYKTESSEHLVSAWRSLMTELMYRDENTKVHSVNSFFNQQIRFAEDIDTWGQRDYWATPLETLKQGRGDCEDYAIAKYFTLLQLGIPSSRLRLVYAMHQEAKHLNSPSNAHMVLAFYPTPDSAPLILDNIQETIEPSQKRHDLTPIFSFNTDGLWVGTGKESSKSSLTRWQELVARTRKDGSIQMLEGTTRHAKFSRPRV